mgnify:FL=1
MLNKLEEKLKQLDQHLSCKIITKDGGKPKLVGDTLILSQHSAGDVLIKYDNDVILKLTEVSGTPAVRIMLDYVDKDNAELLSTLIKLCSIYLPESEED